MDSRKPVRSEETLRLGPIDKIPVGQGHCYLVGKEEIAVLRPRGGSIVAIQNRCPHRNGPLSEGVYDSAKVICPYHGHKFDLATGIGSEGGEKVKVYKVREEEGDIVLVLEEK